MKTPQQLLTQYRSDPIEYFQIATSYFEGGDVENAMLFLNAAKPKMGHDPDFRSFLAACKSRVA